MDEKYVLEIGKMTNAIENLIKNQDKHYSELRNMLNKQREHTESEINSLKTNLKTLEKERINAENELKARLEKAEKFDIKLVAYATVIGVVITFTIKLLPMLYKMLSTTTGA